jgi:gamma-glutamyl:cysteine ligase YbdK (ATP-grasp superfamily)
VGQEISVSRFNKSDFVRFEKRLAEETRLLGEWFKQDKLSTRHGIGGLELEAWLVDSAMRPAPINEAYLAALSDPLLSPELSRFNVELNSTPLPITDGALAAIHDELNATWQRCRHAAHDFAAELVMIGILPTVSDRDLTLANMSAMERYRALNEQVLRLRQGVPIELDILGLEHLVALHGDVMLEAATTSLQIHLQVDWHKAVRYYNAAQILAAPMVAMSANSPLLFGKRLWHETRIALFEQAVPIGGMAGAATGPVRRVTFGSGYVRHSLFEVFRENHEHYPVLLPVDLDGVPGELNHLRLHNGTIWRWNRPLVGFDTDGRPHLRIEHRVVSAGPSVVDSIANVALFHGMIVELAEAQIVAEQQLPFAMARDNFYAAARYGLEARISWLPGGSGVMRELLLEELIPMARRGLAQLGCERDDSDYFIDIVEQRVRSGQTGAAWQLAAFEKYHGDRAALLAHYIEQQNSGAPVHRWTL